MMNHTKLFKNYLEFDVLTGMAYHGISFSAMAANVLYNKYEPLSCESWDQIEELIGFWMVG